jgi:hypothetical protein
MTVSTVLQTATWISQPAEQPNLHLNRAGPGFCLRALTEGVP